MIEDIDWRGFGLPSSMEIGKDGFPLPGQVTRCYRLYKKSTNPIWTQKQLALELGLTERAVCYLESHNKGLDSIFLRRKLAKLLTVPPMFFGLASLEQETDLGHIVIMYRKMKPRDHPLHSQKGLARALSITDKAIRDMEKRNIGLDSITRRRVLAELLDIPPAILGIFSLEDMVLKQQEAITASNVPFTRATKNTSFDFLHYQERLKTLWDRNHTTTAQDRMTRIAADIATLTIALPYVRNDEHEVQALLCSYLQLHAHILRDQGLYDKAIAELEKALILAERCGKSALLVVTLLRIGSVLRDRGDVTEAQAKIEVARGNSTGANQKRRQANADYAAAIDYYSRIRQLTSIPEALYGVLLFDEGYAQMHLTHTNQHAKHNALVLLNKSAKIIAQTRIVLEEEFAIRISDRTYHNTKAAALLTAGWPREALQELTDLMDLPEEENMARQNAYTQYLWSQAYADIGLIDAAAAPAQDAFVVMKHIKSRVHMMRIAGLQGQLSQLDKRHIEVIRLGVMVHS